MKLNDTLYNERTTSCTSWSLYCVLCRSCLF